ncbi:hypothetical protein [Microterricola viridarii]|uniref:hypothetical protein n=1 Tax=Microterricola viridarii TaxID=412690 RepID=UPI0012E9F4B3|nr:hypothetical protein [Microterricola viridarii]
MEIEWTRSGFERLGFVGWKRFGLIERSDLPDKHGVYVVISEALGRPEFLTKSVGGPHKRKPLTVGVDVLSKAWRDGAEIVYIGKAGGRRGLQDRLWAYARQGRGHSAGHAGGRFLWQLPASEKLVVGWREVDGVSDVEEALLALHVAAFQSRPFANLKDGKRMTLPRACECLAAALGVLPRDVG